MTITSFGIEYKNIIGDCVSICSISKYLVIHPYYKIYNATLLPLSAEFMNIMSSHVSISSAELCRINEHQKVALDLDPYVKKLLNARRRVVLVNNILQNAQERLRRLNHNVAKETARRKTMLEASGAF
uniref:Biogenesis of lysosome-related organelles complex 1 subunit 7 n=1 Tax=Sinocyclocheilus rhinocerous TaxID=307959 RepID=A0A673GAI8_9TELE